MAFLSDSLLILEIYLILRKIHHSFDFLNNFQRFRRLDKPHCYCLLLVFCRHLAYENLWDRDVLILNEAFFIFLRQSLQLIYSSLSVTYAFILP
jgi:hypothetical protein